MLGQRQDGQEEKPISAYICDNKTISAIAKAFEQYATRDFGYKAPDYKPSYSFIIEVGENEQRIGQSLLNKNVASVNYRYDEDRPAPVFEYEDVKIDEGIVYGCIRNYEYQACEEPDYFECDVHKSLARLKEQMLRRLIKRCGMNGDCWGYPDDEEAGA